MSIPPKFHHFDVTTFHGLVYCDYCAKMLWGLARQGVQCSDCGYRCHEGCKTMVLQCRPPRHFTPDSLSLTDSEPESLGKYSLSSPRGSVDFGRQQQQHNEDALSLLSSGRSISHGHTLSKRHQQPLDHNGNSGNYPQQKDDTLKSPLLQQTPPVKAYRKALKQHIQHSIHSISPSPPPSGDLNSTTTSMTPQQMAKTFTRLIARSRAFFHLVQYFYDVYDWKSPVKSLIYVCLWILLCLYPTIIILLPPVLIILLFFRSGVQDRPANQILLPRYDEGTPEYYDNLDRTQSCLVFFIRWYDNLAYHLQHASLNTNVYRLLFILSLVLSGLLYVAGRWLILTVGLVVLLNQTWLGGLIETALQLTMEILQTVMDIVYRVIFSRQAPKPTLEVSIYENQRWWTGTGYTSQLLRSERSSWSNITGTEPLPSKENMPPPSHYQWTETWQLDTTGPWSDGILGLVSIIECDDQGWVYTDHKWANPRSRPDPIYSEKDNNTRSLTRRRRWYRKARLVDPAIAKKMT